MNNELEQHKTSDKIKWILTLLAFILVGVMLVGIICGWFDKKDKPAEEQTQANGEFIVTRPDDVLNGMILTVMAMSADAGIATAAENSYSLTATVEPATADDTAVDWSVAWTDETNAWASGKTVTDYVTLTPTSDGSLTVRLSCKKAFAAQITVTVSSRNNPNIKATTTADYRERITGVSCVLTSDGRDYTIAEGVELPYSSSMKSRVNTTKSIGTIAADFDVTVIMRLASEMASKIEYTYGNSWGTGFNSYVTITDTFDMVSAFNTCLTPDVLGQYIDSYYSEQLYIELMNYIKELDCAAVEFTVTLTNKATGAKTEYVYDTPFDKETMIIHISKLTLGSPVIF